ncbi:glycine oxidase ThiO [Bacillus suaedaesalsae]|uniref:glycine oxidase n=1 Tax=Bacillus suaedaesalsae TaxID=2810349 RepID=A0ABS2DGZ1_9BACI|nr:glycine oxidase ThiO [Bacillus suaedaesalsae]
MNSKHDVIIVGGGIIGHSISYSLSKKGMKTLVIEKGKINKRATSAAAGMLAALSEVTDESPLYDIARTSRNMFPKLRDELYENTGIDIELIQQGMLNIAHTEEDAAKLIKMTQFHQSKGEAACWVPTTELNELEPNLSSTICGAMFASNDGHVSPLKLATAFAEGAKNYGGRLLEFTEVTELLIQNERVVGVKTYTDEFYSKNVVIAGGAWASHLLKDLPIFPVKGECFSVTSQEKLITKTIFSDECYIVPKQGNRYIVGATVIQGTYDERVNVAGIHSLLNKAINLLPKLKEAKWEKVWAGIRPQTIDELPFIDEHPTLKGVYVAAGHYRNGILLSPITGERIANLITGEYVNFGTKAFSLKGREAIHEATHKW